MTEQVSLQLPTDMLMQLGVQVFEQAVKTAEQNIIYSHQFVQMYRTKSTPDDQLTLEDYLGAISLKDFNTYWRTRVEAEPGLTIKKGKSQRLYHGFKIAKYIEEHADEVMV
ncbi:hypothetical protein EFL87_02665 [Weissella confusa]|mgnify:FL=1|uniref:hypothetical protein n=1 Tax=Weissella confusa TaxID=1583 RepID=UPI00223AEDC4|nr:hypothetical protein [Weissella confusa]MCT0041401.1 hypothetical protein [Weissella confusa]